MNFNPAAAVSVLINHNHHLNSNNINGNLSIGVGSGSGRNSSNNLHNNNNISNNNNNNHSDSENFVQFDCPLTPATNHSKSMEWTNDDALELIEQYRSHTELWNRGDPKYKDKLCRFRAWSEIAERFGCSKAEVERKMNVLLTQYRREKHKMLVKLYQGIQPSPSKWYAFKRFDFMEAGGGTASLSGSSSLRSRGSDNGSTNGGTGAITSSGSGGGVDSVGIGGSTNGHTIAAAALNELRNFETTSAVAAAAAAAAAAASSSTVGAAATHHHHHQQSGAHRRFKSKEMKYFGGMGLNLPMLIANTQTLDSWNSVGQFSPPIGSTERNQLRVPLPLAFGTAPGSELVNVANTTGRSLFGGSSSSDHTASPQKPMDTADIDDEREVKHEHHSVIGGSEAGEQSLQHLHPQQSDACGDGGGGGGDGGGGSLSEDIPGSSTIMSTDVSHEKRESGSSPIPNTNTHEAHISSRQLSHSQHPHHSRHHDPRSDQEDLDIKEELVDYFHAPNPPAPPGSHRSYSSIEDRLGGVAGTDSDDYAQDLRISAAVAAAAKGLDFSRFVLPRNLRRSTDSNDEDKFTPLNMRKLSNTSGGVITPISATAAVTSAGQMLMNTLLSHESLSNDTTASGRGAGGVKSEASTSAAAAAAAIYAESLNKDDCDFVGSNVSVKLRAMDRDQRIIAEKLISEVLFFGQFNELERTARIQPK